MATAAPIERFISEILKCENCTLERYAAHEAGHRLMWAACFPEVRTHYDMLNGLPCVMPENPPTMKIKEMDQRTAAGHAHVKLAGISAEMRMLGLGGAWEEIGRFLVDDFNALRPRLDWADDWENGGDIPQAINIISSFAGRASLMANLPRFLQNCLFILDSEEEAYQKEVAEAIAFFQSSGSFSHEFAPVSRSGKKSRKDKRKK